MNRYIFLFLIAAFSLLLHAKCVAQKNIVYGAGITYTVGIPTFVPPGNSSRVAIDTVTSKWYEYAQAGGWRWSGDRVQDISGCSAPAYTPGKAQSRLVLNACTEAQNGHGPELYKYTGSAWLCLNCGGNYTAGDGIDITGTEITNTAPDQVVSITGAGINAVTGTYPNFTVTGTEVDGSVTNELQTLSVVGNNLSISDGNTVTLLTPSSTLDALTDVTITSPVNNQILQYNSAGSQWVNATLSAITGSGESGQVSYWNGTTSQTGSSNFVFDGTNLGIGATPLRQLHVSSTFFIGGNIYDNKNNTLMAQSANTVNSNRDFTFGNALYGRAMFSFKSFSLTTGAHPSLGGYNFYVDAGTSTGTGTTDTRFITQSASTTGNRGGDFIISVGSGVGARDGILSVSGGAVINSTTLTTGSVFEAKSTTGIMVPPNMTSTQRDAIATPPNGIIFNTTTGKFQGYAAGTWVDFH